MKLWFENSKWERILVNGNSSEETAIKEITDYVKKNNPNFKIYYFNVAKLSETERRYDFGSHTEFFYLTKE